MQLEQHISLKPYNTFGVDVKADYFVAIQSIADLEAVFSNPVLAKQPLLVLGGGSNLLLTQDFKGLVLKVDLKGINTIEQGDFYEVTAGGGELWNDLVQYSVHKGYAGIENMSLIPGCVGASPIQNIGAYGVELKDVFVCLDAFEIATQKVRRFTKEECAFGYRESVFKNDLKGKYIITSVTIRLQKTAQLNTRYGAIEEELEKRNIEQPTIKDISDVVSYIRVSKLPDPKTIGNSGSFFKNPIVEASIMPNLVSAYPDIVQFPAGEGKVKLAAGWLIEQCGWKGKQVGNTGTWKNQALVLVNHGGATGQEIYDCSTAIIDSVFQKFGVHLEREVNIL